jgi:hypothetical protein
MLDAQGVVYLAEVQRKSGSHPTMESPCFHDVKNGSEQTNAFRAAGFSIPL